MIDVDLHEDLLYEYDDNDLTKLAEDVRQWCEENGVVVHHLSWRRNQLTMWPWYIYTAWFENEDNAVLFKLTWIDSK